MFRNSRSDTKQMSHQDWYQQRYGSAQVNRRKQQVSTAKAAHYEELKELQQERKQTRQENAVSVFAEHGIAALRSARPWLALSGRNAVALLLAEVGEVARTGAT